MTFGEKLERVRHEDPDFARSAKRLRVATWLFGSAVFVALAFAVWAVVVNGQQANQITKIESPCLRYGAKSEQCKEAFEQAVHPEACAILRKAGLEITECAHARLRQERTRHNERVASRGRLQAKPGETQTGGSKENPVRTPHPGGVASHPSQPHHAEPHAPSHPPQPPSKQPSEPTSAAPAPQPSSPRAEQSTEEVEPPVSEVAPPTAPGLIGDPGGLAGEAVCGLNRLLRVCSK